MSVSVLNETAAAFALPDALLEAIGGYKSLVLAAGLTLDVRYPSLLALDPGGSGRTIVLDAPAEQYRFIVNKADAAEALTINNAAAATICTILQNRAALLFGSRVSGWQLVAMFTTTLT